MSDLDLEALERLEAEATPGPWEVWSSNSHLRLTRPGGPDGGVCSAMVASDGVPVLAVRRSNIELIAALRNAARQLIADAKRLRDLRAYLLHTLSNCEGLNDVTWTNAEVLEMVNQMLALGWSPAKEGKAT